MNLSRKTIQTILAGIALVVVVVMIVAYKMYNKPHRAVEDEEALVVTAAQLFGDFEKNESEANKKYLDRVVEVTGKISELSTNMDNKTIVLLETNNLMFGVYCTMSESSVTAQVGSTATIKGICTGYLSDVVIINGILKKVN